MKEIIKKYTLQNAIQYNGEAKFGSVLGKVLGKKPKLKKDIKKLKKEVSKAVDEVNRLSVEEQKEKLKKIDPSLLKTDKTEEKRELPELPEAKQGSVVTRFAPEPGGAIHIGNLRAAMLSYLYAKKYDGEFVLRFEDSNPRKVKMKFYKWIKKDLRRLKIFWDKLVIESDHIDEYHNLAKKILSKNEAYVCNCTQEKFKKLKQKKKDCPCRFISRKENLKKWKKMLDGDYKEGEAVVRLKTSMQHKNPALRDPPLLRIVDHTHPRIGDRYHVYPLYNFACAIEDHRVGVTHILRGKEFEHGARIQKKIYNFFGWDIPVIIQYGRLLVKGPIKLGKRYIRQGLREGTITGWDDIKLATIRSLLRRGIQPEALKKYFIDIGPNKVDIELDWDQLYAYNREIIDPKANRYFFVSDPIRLVIENAPLIDIVKINKHPDFSKRGKRKIDLKYEEKKAIFYIENKDKEKLKEGDTVRLMQLYNIRIQNIGKKIKATFQDKDIETAREKDFDFIHWLPISQDLVDVRVLMPDDSVMEGLGEPEMKNLNKGELLQLTRNGFCKVDKINKEIILSFAHR